ncbi:MAG TPA: malic enzyme-like NAD(P)-binding protein [Pseudonocardiaceae bacterium]|jgi:malate dehydrogenase (oxaloacetate-decarboxylating)|nr:malic enzyme-like NAD(P)-binding protein [Pseudonocardiaceae bacterium]
MTEIGSRIQATGTASIDSAEDLAKVYTPGVADAVRAIADDPAKARELTTRRDAVAVVSDGSAVLGLGDVGALAALPVLEGKAALFHRFAGLNAWPLCVNSRDVDGLVDAIAAASTGFAAINLEDIAAPRCFDVDRKLGERLDIPVFHDDQHGTAIVVLAGLRNAFRVTGHELTRERVVIAGAGAAGSAIARLLRHVGVDDVVVCDSKGALHPGRDDLSGEKKWLADNTNPRRVDESLPDALADAGVFLGVSVGGLLDGDDLAGMSADAIVFALANPDPEVDLDQAAEHAAVVASGRSDRPNQINNVLAFPGVLRGLVDSGSGTLSLDAQRAAAEALADVVSADDLGPDHIVPGVFDEGLHDAVAEAVVRAAKGS